LHISHPTISRDIGLIRNHNSSKEKRKNLAHSYYYEHQNALDGVGELMKNLWLIIGNQKIEVKERMKAKLDNAVLLYEIQIIDRL
jgi:hypothetical protein